MCRIWHASSRYFASSTSLFFSHNKPFDCARITSIDVMRGLVVLVWMLSDIGPPVLNRLPSNSVTDAFTAQLSPSFWDGATVRDLILPAFCFIAGASLPPAFKRRKEASRSNRDLSFRIGRRMVLLFAIGLLCEGGLFNGSSSLRLSNLRLVGAFQRIAICYALVACVELSAGWRFQAVLAAFLLLGYWVVLAVGGRGSRARNPFSLEGNVAAAVDQLILPGRKYFATWDPEGILTTVPALAVTIAGMLAGKILSTGPQSRGNISLWFVGAGIAAFNLAFLWDFVLPINPYLWTSSFCMVAIAAGLILLGLLHAAFDARAIASWTKPITIPLVAIGRNPLTVVLATLALSRAVRPTAPRLSLIQTLFPEASPTIPSVTLIAIVVIAVALWLNGRRSYFIA
jgi:predicted acyltransferase